MTKKVRTIADLRAAHDKNVVVPNRIRATIALLQSSGDEWAYEADFLALQAPAISQSDIGKYRDDFKDFWALMPATNSRSHARRVWFASKALADQWKKAANG